MLVKKTVNKDLVAKAERFAQLAEYLKPLNKELDDLKKEFKELYGKQDFALDCGSVVITRKTTHKTRFDATAMKKVLPKEVWSPFQVASSSTSVASQASIAFKVGSDIGQAI